MRTRSRRWVAALQWPTAAEHAGITARVRFGAFLQVAPSEAIELPVALTSGATQQQLDGARDLLRSFYRCARVEALADSERGDRAVVALHYTSLPQVVTFPSPASSGLLPPSASHPIPLGIDASASLVGVPLFDDETGGSSLLVGGVPGTGKSTALRVVLAGVAQTTSAIVFIDPAGGAEASLWQHRCATTVTTAEPEPTITALNQVLRLIERRGRMLAAGWNIRSLQPVVLVCDELAELAAAGTAKQQDEARSALRRVIGVGRKANIAAVLATQRTTATSIDVTTRALVSWRLALAHPDDHYGSEALLGPGRRQAADLRKADVGAGWLTNGGPPTLVRVFELPRPSFPTCAAAQSPRWPTWTPGSRPRCENSGGRERCERCEDPPNAPGDHLRTVIQEPASGGLQVRRTSGSATCKDITTWL